jgi:hypothetical protein
MVENELYYFLQILFSFFFFSGTASIYFFMFFWRDSSPYSQDLFTWFVDNLVNSRYSWGNKSLGLINHHISFSIIKRLLGKVKLHSCHTTFYHYIFQRLLVDPWLLFKNSVVPNSFILLTNNIWIFENQLTRASQSICVLTRIMIW